MCFAPQRRAISPHPNLQKWREHVVLLTFWLRNVLRATAAYLNFQKWSEAGVLCTFWLGNVLRATTACTFLTSKLPKVVRTWCFVLFCTCWLGNVLRATTACNFSSLLWPAGSAPAALASLLFDSPEPQIIGKKQCFATFPPFRASASSVFLLFFLLIFLFSMPLPCSAFHLSILSEVWLLNFLRLVREVAIFNSTRGFRASAFGTGFARYARLRFARVPRVLFCSGSTRGVAFKFL